MKYQSYYALNNLSSLERFNNELINAGQRKKYSKKVLNMIIGTQKYLQISKSLSNCLKGTEQKLGLESKISSLLASKVLSDEMEECFQNSIETVDADSFEGFRALFNKIDKDTQYRSYTGLQDTLYEEAIQNAAETYAELELYTNNKNPKKLTYTQLYDILGKKVCHAGLNTFEKKKEFEDKDPYVPMSCYREVEKIAKKYTKRERIPIDEAVDAINPHLKRLNEKAYNAVSNNSQSNYHDYQRAYSALASVGPGLLLNTDVMKGEGGVGGPVSFEEMKETKNGFNFHREISSRNKEDISMMNKALSEAKSKTLKSIGKINAKYKLKPLTAKDSSLINDRKEDIKELVKYYPSAAATSLFNHGNPESVFQICEAIKSAEEDRSDREDLDKAMFWGGMVVGGVLLATGVGAGAGAAVMAGTATAATLTTVSSVVAGAGIVTGLAEAVYHTESALYHQDEYENLQSSLYGGGGAEQAQVSAALEKYESALINAAISGAFAGLSVAGEIAALRHLKKLKPKEIEAIAEEIEILTKTGNPEKLDLLQVINKSNSTIPQVSIDDLLPKLRIGESPRFSKDPIKAKSQLKALIAELEKNSDTLTTFEKDALNAYKTIPENFHPNNFNLSENIAKKIGKQKTKIPSKTKPSSRKDVVKTNSKTPTKTSLSNINTLNDNNSVIVSDLPLELEGLKSNWNKLYDQVGREVGFNGPFCRGATRETMTFISENKHLIPKGAKIRPSRIKINGYAQQHNVVMIEHKGKTFVLDNSFGQFHVDFNSTLVEISEYKRVLKEINPKYEIVNTEIDKIPALGAKNKEGLMVLDELEGFF